MSVRHALLVGSGLGACPAGWPIRTYGRPATRQEEQAVFRTRKPQLSHQSRRVEGGGVDEGGLAGGRQQRGESQQVHGG